jgi:hypothetical protein
MLKESQKICSKRLVAVADQEWNLYKLDEKSINKDRQHWPHDIDTPNYKKVFHSSGGESNTTDETFSRHTPDDLDMTIPRIQSL